jgi:hypothetical protein
MGKIGLKTTATMANRIDQVLNVAELSFQPATARSDETPKTTIL